MSHICENVAGFFFSFIFFFRERISDAPSSICAQSSSTFVVYQEFEIYIYIYMRVSVCLCTYMCTYVYKHGGSRRKKMRPSGKEIERSDETGRKKKSFIRGNAS